jgi:CBS domain containing-hemolysin-like protein
VDRLYTEMGKFFLMGVQDNLEVFERDVEPALKLDRGRGGLTFALLTQMMILGVAILGGYLAFAHGALSWGGILQTVVLLIVTVVVLAHLVPHVLITRTDGKWLVRFRPVLRVSALIAMPVVAVLSFSFSVAALGAEASPTQQTPAPGDTIEALIERSEEEGLIEEEDRKLIQSVVDFGDKTVRDVMTPRPNIVAVEKNVTLDELLKTIETKHYSRVPVYSGTLDKIEGFVYTREIIQLEDQEMKRIRAGERLRPVLFVPETKPVADLMREMQQQNLHMAIVIDEYGSVAGLATIEDLVEEIVGEIHDETETQRDVVAEGNNSFIVAGHLDIDRLNELFGVRPDVPAGVATVAGLVNSLAGHVPQAGEVLDHNGLEFQILASNGLKVDRLRIRARPAAAGEVSAPAAR